MSFDDVQGFIQKLNAKTGKHYCLPTEAEWEYACRAGVDYGRYCGGDDPAPWVVTLAAQSIKPIRWGKSKPMDLACMI